MNPWTVAQEELAKVGPGPYIPLTYSYSTKTIDNKSDEERTQIYVVASRILRSASTFEVREHNSVTNVEEVPFGLLYVVILLLIYIGGIAWGMYRRLSLSHASDDSPNNRFERSRAASSVSEGEDR
jgi:hypothetical protein